LACNLKSHAYFRLASIHSTDTPESKMNKSIFAVSLLLTTLVGCSTVRDAIKSNVVIEEPAGGPTARIRVITPKNAAKALTVRGYPKRDCIDRGAPGSGNVIGAVVGFERHLNGRSLGMPASELSKNDDFIHAEINAAANQPIAFQYWLPEVRHVSNAIPYLSTYTVSPGCSVEVSFVPEPGADYELSFEGCAYTGEKLLATPSGAKSAVSAVPIEVKRVGQCRK
jgi:hypothetical protein